MKASVRRNKRAAAPVVTDVVCADGAGHLGLENKHGYY